MNTTIDDRYPVLAGKMIEYNFYGVTRVNNDMTSYNDKNDAVANKNAGGGAETCMSLSLALLCTEHSSLVFCLSFVN